MLNRCRKPDSDQFRYYGARGIRVCERWLEFSNFLADMGERPTGKTLDRIDNDGNYEPGNCRWATHAEQMSNSSRNVRLTFRGETLTLTQWAQRIGVGKTTLACRLRLGWTVEEALTAPLGPQGPHRIARGP
jgi:hypothetical protein